MPQTQYLSLVCTHPFSVNVYSMSAYITVRRCLVWEDETHCCWVSALPNHCFSHLVTLTDCVQNLKLLVLHETSYFFSSSQNLLTAFITIVTVGSDLL